MDEAIWGHAPWTEEFEDIEGDLKPTPRFSTRVRMLWDDDYSSSAPTWRSRTSGAPSPNTTASSINDNDFEVFLDLNGTCQHYVELELNLLNTTWDLMLSRPYRAGGVRFNGWEFHGLRTSIHVDGTLNDPSRHRPRLEDRDCDSMVLAPRCDDRPLPPRDGDQIRIGFSRVEWHHEIVDGQYQRVPGLPEDNWVWTPTGVIDMHRPERWGVLQFTDSTTDLPPLVPLEEWGNRVALIDLFEAQLAFKNENGRYAATLSDLGVDHPGMTLESTSSQFFATLGSFGIDHQWRLSRI